MFKVIRTLLGMTLILIAVTMVCVLITNSGGENLNDVQIVITYENILEQIFSTFSILIGAILALISYVGNSALYDISAKAADNPTGFEMQIAASGGAVIIFILGILVVALIFLWRGNR